MSSSQDLAFAREDAEAAWRPGPEQLEEARLAGFIRASGAAGLEELQARAARDPAWFWSAAADDIGIAWQRPPTTILDLAGGPARATWWGGGSFNHAVAATEPWARLRPDEQALAWEGEDGEIRQYTWAELDRAARLAARRLAATGIGIGSRVGIFLPMLPETVIAVLALGRLGAIFTPIFSGYAAPAVAARLEAFAATHLITADGFLRRGAVIPLKEVADAAVALAPTVRRVIVVRRLPATPIEIDPQRDLIWDGS
ncbi:MAG TPA: AMP-binding protein, partial [Candidatus Limnocylindrales bacterium]